MTPIFEIFNLSGSPFYMASRSDWAPLSAENIGLSLSHLVPVFYLKVYFQVLGRFSS